MSKITDRARLLLSIRKEGITDQKILSAFEAIPRHLFVPKVFSDQAYDDIPVPIACDQTVSQPSLVAFMINALEVGERMKVLEIGTGCGYQTAILSILSKKVITLDVLSSLSRQSQKRLIKLGYNNVDFHCADGKLGWKKEAPYDRILVSAAPVTIPEILIEQLAPEGYMVIPVGSLNDQLIHVITKDGNENIRINKSTPVRFVPLV